LWRIQQDVTASCDVPQERADGAAEVVREFHIASGGIEQGDGTFSLERFERTWGQRGAHDINTVLHAQHCTLLEHPLSGLLRSVIEAVTADAIYDRALSVLGMHDERPLAQFRAALKIYQDRPLVLITNVAEDVPRLVKHWGRMRLPPEVDVQDDPAIHYHLRDLFTGRYVRSGEVPPDAASSLPGSIWTHVLQVEDVVVQDMARWLPAHRDVSTLSRTARRGWESS
jgi:hypothetical protein